MSSSANGASGERGKEYQCLLMHPSASIVQGCNHFYPYGRTPPEYLLGGVPMDARRADMLLLGCSDARHALFTLWTYGSECSRERGRWDGLTAEERRQQNQQHPDGLRTLRFTMNDREPACLARVLLLLQLFCNSHDDLLRACSPNASPELLDAYSARIALCFNAYYNIYVDNATLQATQAAANQLLEASASSASWSMSPVGSIAHIAGRSTLNRLRYMWYVYADTSIVQIKPKKQLDKERKTYHDRTVFPSKNASPILLTGEGPGIAAPKAMEWGTEMTGIHRQYQSWGYLDPFPVLRDAARSDRKYYTKTNPAMVATDHEELDYQVHHNCNPLSAFHHDDVWLPFKPREHENTHDGGRYNMTDTRGCMPLYAGPPRVTGVNLTVTESPLEFEDEPEEAKQHIMSKLVATSLEQLSRMCWAVSWARLEKEEASSAALAKQGRPRPSVDVRMNFVLGDAVDTCDAMCLLSSEGLAAWGKARDGHEPGRVCSFMPNMSLSPCQLDLADLDGPARFDLIDSSYLADNLGILNVVMATSPLLKPSPHAVVRTDLRRSGPARKRLTRAKDVEAAVAAQAEAEKSVEGFDAKGNKKKMKKKETKMAAAAYAALTDEDWCTTKVQECALLLGVVPVSGVAPAVGHFHTMLEAVRAAKTNKENADIGDLGQRLRLAWKQVCLIDQRAGAFVASEDRVATTLHPRVDLSPEEFADLMLPFWLFMTRSLYVEASNCPKVLEGGQHQLRVSPYTPASFARLVSHSLRFLKFDAAHTRELVEHLHENYSTGLFDSNVVDQLDVHMHLLSLFRTEAMDATDVVRWALDCPWWDKKPSAEGVVPKGSPGMCRVVMLAPEEAVSIVRHLRNPALCILMNDESQNVKTLISTLHCCFVRVNRGSGPSPPEGKEGEPWYVLRERLLRVKETVPDDPEAELMVSFLLGSKTLIPAKANQMELELRLQDSAARGAAPASVAKSLETAEGVIFRTNLGERGETAVVFPNKRNTANTLERWLPQSSERHLLLQDDKGVEPGLGQRRVGKMNRYVIAPGRPGLYLPTGPLRKKSDWASNVIEVDEGGGGRYMGYILNMANPAARDLLADKQTETKINVLPPCGVEIIMHAPEKKDGGKGKKKRKGTSEDLSKGGVDGGLRFLAILPFPVESAYEGGGDSDELFVVVHTYEDHMLNPFVNVLQTSRADGAKLSRPLLSNWSFPVRSVADGRRLKVCEATKEYVYNMDLWLFEHGPLDNMPLLRYHSLCRHMMSKFMSDGVKALEDGGVGAGVGKSPTGRHWHLAKVGYGASTTADAFFASVGPEMDIGVYVTVHVEDILVDEGNESLLLDVTLCLWDSQLPADFFVAENGPSALATARARGCEIVVPFLDQLLPMAVERGRRTYCHRPDCRYLATTNSGGAGWGGRGGDGKGKDDPPLCLCAAGKDISPSLVKGLRDSGRAEVLPRLYHAVLPTLVAVDDVEGFRLKSSALVDDEGGERGGFAHLKKPVGQSSGAMLSYNGPIRGVGNIVESVPVAAVQERGGGVADQPLGSVSPSAANAFGEVEGNDSYANGKPSSTAVSSAKADSLVGVDEETRRILAKAGLGRMPANTFEWVKFERVQQGLPADPPCPLCQEPKARKRCTRCKIVKYCSRECQRKHWRTHKLECYADS